MNILIINSKGHWLNGSMSFPENLEAVQNTLQKTGCQVKSIEVQSLSELDTVLQNTEQDTLVWANAYLVDGENGALHGLPEQIQKYQLPSLGSDWKTLTTLMEKDTCQKMLKKVDIPTPNFLTIDNDNIANIGDLIDNSSLSFPLVVKPTKESRSHGVTKVDSKEEAVSTIKRVQQTYPESNIIIEEFLPYEDVTCGYLTLGDQIMLLPSYIVIKGMDYSTEVFSEEHYKMPVAKERQTLIQDPNILEQFEKYVPRIIDLFKINSTTRTDGRLDEDGILRFFDINGMPGLNYPDSALVRQCFIHFPSYPEDYIFECLINTIVLDSCQRFNLPTPPAMQTRQLFNLESTTILKVHRKENYVV